MQLFKIHSISFELIFQSDTVDSEIMEFVHAVSKIFVALCVDFFVYYLAASWLTLGHR